MPSVLWTSLRSHSPHGNLLLVGLPSTHDIAQFRRRMSLRFLLVAGLFMLLTPGSQIWTLGPWRRLGRVRRSCHGLYASSSMALTTGRSVLKGAGLQSHGKLILCNRPPAACRHMMVCWTKFPTCFPHALLARLDWIGLVLLYGRHYVRVRVLRSTTFGKTTFLSLTSFVFSCAVCNPAAVPLLTSLTLAHLFGPRFCSKRRFVTSGASGRLVVTSLSGPSLRCFVVWSGYATAFGCIRVRLRTSWLLRCPKPWLVWPSPLMPIRCLAWTVSTRSARLSSLRLAGAPLLRFPGLLDGARRCNPTR